MSVPITLTHSLANDSRAQLEPWLEDVETQARNQCPPHDITGALSLVVPDKVWQLVPGNITNPVRVPPAPHLPTALVPPGTCQPSTPIRRLQQ
jgi:hypothetical protein